MSLLNQVLQDLQERQAPDINGAPATLRDVRITPRGTARPSQRPWLLWAAVLVLAGVSGSLLWQRGRPVTAPAALAVIPPAAQPVAAATATPAKPDHAIAPAATPIAAARVSPPSAAPQAQSPAPPARTDALVAVAPPPTPAAAQTTTAVSAPVVSELAPAPRGNAVEKTARPLSQEQHAELIYQDAQRLQQSGRPSAAEPRLRAALDTDPAHRAARTALAGMLINAGRLPEATTLLAAGLAVAPTYAPFAKLYARLRIDQGELAQARAVLERAAPAVRDDPEYHALLAALYQRLGLYEQAAQTYRGALQAQPRNGVWWLGLGLALEGAGDRANALQAYQRAQQSGALDAEVLRYVDSKIAALQSGHGERR